MPVKDPLRMVWWIVAAIFLVFGWVFILWQNKMNLTAPVVVVCLAYLAVVATVMNLWRVGAAAVAPEDATVEAWSRPLGERGELEKEKKTLLKAIKEAEFDHAMGKLSKADADSLIAMYRGRAIEVIKALDALDVKEAANDTRSKIEREVAARIALEQGMGKGKGKGKGKQSPKAEPKPKAPAEKRETFAPPPVATDDDVDDAEDVIQGSDVATTNDVISTPADDHEEAQS